MEKKLIGLAIAIILVVGLMFVSANTQADSEEKPTASSCEIAEPICGSSTCNQQCGGSCGIPRCGCS